MPPTNRATLAPLLTLFLFAAALWVVATITKEYRLHEIGDALRSVSLGALALSAALTVAGYLSLVGCDVVAFRIIRRPLPLRAMLAPSFASFAVSNSAPASVLTAGGVRYRLYAPMGLTLAEAATVAGINVVTYAVGLCALSGLALVARPIVPANAPAWLRASGRGGGALLVLVAVAYVALAIAGRRAIRIGTRELRLPTARLALAQLGVSAADWLLSSGALYVLLSSVGRAAYPEFLVRFLVAAVVSLVVPIPGGLGVFEAVVLYLTANGAPAPRVLAALLAYRVIYYLLPLLAAGVVLVVRAMGHARRSGTHPRTWATRMAVGAAHHVVAFTTFLSGALLLLTGAIPGDERRLAWLARVIPLSMIELSHFLASVLGAALLVVSWGLELRVRSAYRIARLLFGVGIVLTLVRSFDTRLAGALGLALLVLLAADRGFPRGGDRSLLRAPLDAPWVLAIGGALVVTLWAVTLAVRAAGYSGELWWRFALDASAPRSLRAAVGVTVALLVFALARFLARRAPPA